MKNTLSSSRLLLVLLLLGIFNSCKKDNQISDSADQPEQLMNDPSLKILSILHDPAYMDIIMNEAAKSNFQDFSFNEKVSAEQEKITSELISKYSLGKDATDVIFKAIISYREGLTKTGTKDEWRWKLLPQPDLKTNNRLSVIGGKNRLKSSASIDLPEVGILGINISGWRSAVSAYTFKMRACDDGYFYVMQRFEEMINLVYPSDPYPSSGSSFADFQLERARIERAGLACKAFYNSVPALVREACKKTPPNPPDPGVPGTNPGGGGGTQSPADVFVKKIDNTKLKPCMQNVLNDINSLQGGKIPDILTLFSGSVPGYNWTLEDARLGANTNGQTNSIYDTNSQSAITKFDSQKFTQASDLAIARTIMHEAVHAYLVDYFKLDRVNAALSYPEMVEQWTNTKNPNLNDAHHDDMVNNFVGQIASALTAYGDKQGYTFTSNSEKTQFYNDLSWGGLTNTRAFNNFPTATKDRINDRLNSEQCQTDKNGNSKPSKGKKGGC